MGNIITLRNRCKWRGLDFEYIEINAGDKIPCCDMYFIGGGQDHTIDLASAAASGAGSRGDAQRDDYFCDAARFIIEKDKASIGMLQRVFKIGFNRAARIMDQLAQAGVVGEEEGTKPRKVLMTKEEFEEFIKEESNK